MVTVWYIFAAFWRNNDLINSVVNVIKTFPFFFFSIQSEDHQEHCDGERGADGGAVEAEVREREGEEQDPEEYRHLAGERAQSLEEWWEPQPWNNYDF